MVVLTGAFSAKFPLPQRAPQGAPGPGHIKHRPFPSPPGPAPAPPGPCLTRALCCTQNKYGGGARREGPADRDQHRDRQVAQYTLQTPLGAHRGCGPGGPGGPGGPASPGARIADGNSLFICRFQICHWHKRKGQAPPAAAAVCWPHLPLLSTFRHRLSCRIRRVRLKFLASLIFPSVPILAIIPVTGRRDEKFSCMMMTRPRAEGLHRGTARTAEDRSLVLRGS